MSSVVSSHVDVPELFDVVLVKRPKRWRPKDTHELPPRSNVVSVEMYGVDEIEADDCLAEINSADWCEEWAIKLPHMEQQPIVRERKGGES